MADANSTAINAEQTSPKPYFDFANEVTSEVFRLKSLLAGAKSLVHENESIFVDNENLLDAVYILEAAVEKTEKLATKISDSCFDFAVKS